MSGFPCRSCRSPVMRLILDLGEMPLANAYREPGDESPEARHPLRLMLCTHCYLAQLDHSVSPAELFGDYAYFSSYSDSWLLHAKTFADWATNAFSLGSDSLVMEVASNDGYLLRHFAAEGIPVIGVEPAANVAALAVASGVPTEVCFFDSVTAAQLVAQHGQPDLIAANNVLAHVPDLADFVAGIATALGPGGVFSVEFPHLLKLMAGVQFDTIYHEHFSYLSLLALERVFSRHGLRVWDLEQLPTHGGSLRLLVVHRDDGRATTAAVATVRDDEERAGLSGTAAYDRFAGQVEACRVSLLAFLSAARAEGRTVAGYGAAAKGNTLLNYCAVSPRDLPFVVDRSPHKQGRLLPGTRIPVLSPDEVERRRPHYLLLLPWNLADEITEQMSGIRAWGGQFVIPIPTTRVLS